MTASEKERLTRIETLLEEAVIRRLNDVSDDIKSIKTELAADKADLAALKNKGLGLLIGVGIAGGAAGASLTKYWHAIFG